jgi:hypothetical protein
MRESETGSILHLNPAVTSSIVLQLMTNYLWRRVVITTTKGILYSNFISGTRATAIQSFFAQIEIKYGNLSQLVDSPNTPAAETIVSSDGELHVEHLERLFTHDATAIHPITTINVRQQSWGLNYYMNRSRKIIMEKEGGIGSLHKSWTRK